LNSEGNCFSEQRTANYSKFRTGPVEGRPWKARELSSVWLWGGTPPVEPLAAARALRWPARGCPAQLTSPRAAVGLQLPPLGYKAEVQKISKSW